VDAHQFVAPFDEFFEWLGSHDASYRLEGSYIRIGRVGRQVARTEWVVVAHDTGELDVLAPDAFAALYERDEETNAPPPEDPSRT